ncbi:MAG: DUF2062 domain-containing protein [Candidatus Omnitrophica bacterium]|nr:DUF2062 domain-containing protein [Candidatus Omnitrophota bacterium]MDD5042286.1 DUF2062 domain-containing protein [Candidatus Omnitrophota bacterium]MDD5500141.1 DUF2062 domain-containing protein [Candidatus Omnitrophota bacterium]
MKWKIKRFAVRLLKMNNSPRGIALGVALGVFIGILPLYGLHTLLVIIVAIIVRPANKIAIFLGTSISLPPTVPPITWAGYEIGRHLLKGDFEPLTWSVFKGITLEKVLFYYRPLFLGSLVLGFVCAVIFYCLTFFITRKINLKRKSARRKAV